MLFDSTLRRELNQAFGATFIVIMTIVITMFLIRTLGQAAGGAISPQDVALLIGYVGLENLPTMLSLSLFVAVVASLTRMYRDSEMVIWLSAGVGLHRFVWPVLRMAAPLLALVALLALFVWPWGNRQVAELKDRFQRRSDVARVAPGQFQTSADGSRVFFIDRDSNTDTIARNVFVVERRGSKESVTAARSGRVEMDGDQRFAVLEQGERNDLDLLTGEKKRAEFQTYRVLVGEAASNDVDQLPPKARSTWQLLTQPNNRYLGELTWRFGIALGGINLTLLAIGLAAGNPRRTGSWNLLFALLTFFVYYNMVNLSESWVATGRLSIAQALLALHGGALALAILLLWWRERGSAVGWPRRAR